MVGWPPIDGDPFELARESCLQAAEKARDVFIHKAGLEHFVSRLDVSAVQQVMSGSMGENCDTSPEEFRDVRDAVSFAILFSLLQFGHGFRYELHEICGRGASKTITLGVRNLRSRGNLCAARLRSITETDVRKTFGLPDNPELQGLTLQLLTVIRQAGAVLDRLGLEDFYAFAKQADRPEEARSSAATLVRLLANRFPAFNDRSSARRITCSPRKKGHACGRGASPFGGRP